MTELIAAVEGGGTSFKVCIGKTFDEALNNIFQVDTTNPEDTLEPIKTFFKQKETELNGKIKKLGIANFGPIDIKAGSILPSTPKVAWRGFNIVSYFKKEFPEIDHINFDTDVNGPAMAEFQQVKDEGIDNLAYVTIGTGIGIGLVINQKPVHGLMHPEGGHIRVPLHERDISTGFKGFCTFHTDGCLEGVAATPGIAKRKNISVHDIKGIPDDDEIWDIEAHYLAHLCATLILVSSCQVIVLGGGVMKRHVLFDKIRLKTVHLLNNYHVKVNDNTIQDIIRESKYTENSGIVGALYLAQTA
ncbi:hypothetical protein ABK040_009879 [Willaertia magna]